MAAALLFFGGWNGILKKYYGTLQKPKVFYRKTFRNA